MSDTISKSDINLSPARQSKYIVRQDRLPTDPEITEVKVQYKDKELSFRCINISAFGVGAIHSERFDMNQTDFYPIKVIYDDFVLIETTVRLARLDETAGGQTLYGFEILGEPVSMDALKGLEMAMDFRTKINDKVSEISSVPSEFIHEVLEIKDFLTYMHSELKKIESELPTSEPTERSEIEAAFIQSFARYLSHVVPEQTEKLQKLWDNYNEATKLVATNYFRTSLKELLFSAPFSARAYFKPRGYAGDYEMMNQLYRQDIAGPDLFARCLHYYFVKAPSAQAVRNRASYMLGKIKKLIAANPGKKLRILSVASGPAWEIQSWYKEFGNELSDQVEFCLLDQDEHSLKHAQKQINIIARSQNFRPNVNLFSKDIRILINEGLKLGEFDMIYSAGLFDYLSAPVARITGKRLIKSLKPGCDLIIGNFNFNNPNLPVMNLVFDWQLIYRSDEEMMNIFKGIGSNIEIEREDLNINLFAVIKKDGTD